MPDRFDDFALRLRDSDNVAVAKRPLAAGLALNGSISLTTDREIPAGHKIAVASIAEGQPILKYGQVIGYARKTIAPGQHVHTHNVAMRADADDRTQLAHECCIDYRPIQLHPQQQSKYFPGYQRPDGRVGTRNYIGVISSVNCSASVSRYVADRF